jgi:hypothetical protein
MIRNATLQDKFLIFRILKTSDKTFSLMSARIFFGTFGSPIKLFSVTMQKISSFQKKLFLGFFMVINSEDRYLINSCLRFHLLSRELIYLS